MVVGVEDVVAAVVVVVVVVAAAWTEEEDVEEEGTVVVLRVVEVKSNWHTVIALLGDVCMQQSCVT
jgi:hypothetical protein